MKKEKKEKHNSKTCKCPCHLNQYFRISKIGNKYRINDMTIRSEDDNTVTRVKSLKEAILITKKLQKEECYSGHRIKIDC